MIIALLLALSAQAPADLGVAAFDPAVSPDGRWLAYASEERLWVQPLAGGSPRAVTAGPHGGYEPSFSSDSQLLAYRSETGGGGIYLVPVRGGKPRRLAADGQRPRFAPNGRRLAYHAAGKLFVHDLHRSRRLQPGFFSAADPVWSPDGKQILFAGCKDASAGSCDWWLSPSEGSGDPVATKAAAHFVRLKLEGLPSPDLWLAKDNLIVFTARVGENTRLWGLRLQNGAAEGPRRLTTAETDERTPAAAPDGRIIYGSRSGQNVDVYTFGLRTRVLTRLTTDPALDQRPSLSRDGRHVAWETSRGGNFEVWVKDLISGKEQALTSGPLREHMPAMAPDGASLVYDVHDGDKVTILRTSFHGGEPTVIHEERTGQGSFQWTTQADSVLYFHRDPPGTVGLLNLATRQRTPLLRHPKLNLSLGDARLSPNRRWIVFPVPWAPHRSRLAVAPVNGAVIDSESQWTYLLPDTYNSVQPEWSPDGKWLYFLANQSGRLAVHGIAMSPAGLPDSQPKLILPFNGPHLSISELRPRDIGLAVAVDKLALAAVEYSSTLRALRP